MAALAFSMEENRLSGFLPPFFMDFFMADFFITDAFLAFMADFITAFFMERFIAILESGFVFRKELQKS